MINAHTHTHTYTHIHTQACVFTMTIMVFRSGYALVAIGRFQGLLAGIEGEEEEDDKDGAEES